MCINNDALTFFASLVAHKKRVVKGPTLKVAQDPGPS